MKLAVFDCDGTLLDSQANILRAMDACFGKAGLPTPEAHRVRQVVGLSLPQAMAALLPEAEPALCLRLAESYKQAFRSMRNMGSLDPEPMFAGIAELLAALEAEGWLLAVATGKSDRGLRHALEHHGIHNYFISLQTADHHPSKPHPAMLLAAMAEAGMAADDSAIIGDTHFDMEMGQAAGVRAIGVSWGYHAPDALLAAGAIGVATDAAHLKELLYGR